MSDTYVPTAQEKEFYGLSKKGAQNLAERKAMIFRLIRVGDEKFFEYPTDYQSDRVSVEIDTDNKVVKAKIG